MYLRYIPPLTLSKPRADTSPQGEANHESQYLPKSRDLSCMIETLGRVLRTITKTSTYESYLPQFFILNSAFFIVPPSILICKIRIDRLIYAGISYGITTLYLSKEIIG